MRIPKALYVIFSPDSNPHANAPIEVFTMRRHAERECRWGDQRLVTFTRAETKTETIAHGKTRARERALLNAFEAWWRVPIGQGGSFPPPSVLDAAEALYGPPGAPASATMAPCSEPEHSDDGTGGAS